MIGQQRPPYDDIELARHQNLLKIQQLRQTLEAAQQQEAQYKSQLEVNVSRYRITERERDTKNECSACNRNSHA